MNETAIAVQVPAEVTASEGSFTVRVRNPDGGQSPPEPHHRETELGGQPGVGAGGLLHGRHVFSLGHYLC